MMTLGDIFGIPQAVHRGDFVLRLMQGLSAGQLGETRRTFEAGTAQRTPGEADHQRTAVHGARTGNRHPHRADPTPAFA